MLWWWYYSVCISLLSCLWHSHRSQHGHLRVSPSTLMVTLAHIDTFPSMFTGSTSCASTRTSLGSTFVLSVSLRTTPILMKGGGGGGSRWISWHFLPWELEGIISSCCLLIGQYPHHMTLCQIEKMLWNPSIVSSKPARSYTCPSPTVPCQTAHSGKMLIQRIVGRVHSQTMLLLHCWEDVVQWSDQ